MPWAPPLARGCSAAAQAGLGSPSLMWQGFALCANHVALQQGHCNDMAERVSELKNKFMPSHVFKPHAEHLLSTVRIYG